MNNRNSKIVLYTRQGCHLCDEAAAVLAHRGLEFDCVDVDQDPQLHPATTSACRWW